MVDDDPVSGLDEVLWQAWKAMDLPEGYRAEIIEGAIEVSPIGRRRHGVLINRLRRSLDTHLAGSDFAPYQDGNLIHRRKCWIPDLLTSPNPKKADYADEHRVPYGTDAVIPEGPTKGFVIGESVTGP
ncbi:hypothetical protein [Streptomyces sp. SYSU K217416]